MLPLQAAGTFWGNVAQLLQRTADVDGAAIAARRFLATVPDDHQAKSLLASLLGDTGKLDEAISLAREVAGQQSADPQAHYLLGLLLARVNQIAEARDSFSKVLAIDPKHALALEYLAYLDNGDSGEQLIQDVDDALADQVEAGNAALHYAKARILERSERWNEAFEEYQAGARIMKSNARVDLPSMEKYVGRLKESFSLPYFDQHAASAFENRRPIFIVGMPRSGTTLVEAILSAHSNVIAGGESALLRMATLPFGSFEPPDLAKIDALLKNGKTPWASMGKSLQMLHEGRFGPGPRITEKNLGNHFFLGAVALIASGAAIIYCRRDAVATAWSCFKTRFTRGNGWSYDFESIAHYQRLYNDLMVHWQGVLPGGPIMEVQYEELVEQPGQVIPELLSHAGLTFEDSCLSPHQSDMPVLTASLTEVRQPIYTTANAAWRNYEDHLAPYLDRLRSS